MEAKLHPKAHLEAGHAGASDLGSCEALLTKKLQTLALQNKDAARPALDPSCLLTPPNTPQNLELTDSATVRPEEGDGTLCAFCVHRCGACQLYEPCVCVCVCVFVGEREESEIEDGVFVLELQRAACGLGLMLVDGEVSESRRY